MKKTGFNIQHYKSQEEIIKIIDRLGSHKLTETSHTYLEFGSISILESSIKSTLNYSDFAKEKPALGLIAVVLAANRNYNKVVEPNLIRIDQTDLKDFTDLTRLIDSYSMEEFYDFWGHKDEKKYNTLKGILAAIAEIKKANPTIDDDFLILNHWAKNLDLNNYREDRIGKLHNVAIATIQHLRMVFGIDTVKPDQRVKEVLVNEFGLPKLSDEKAIMAVEQIARVVNLQVITIDQILVKYGSGYYNQVSGGLSTKEIARKLKYFNVDIDIISKSTNLSYTQIAGL